MNRQQLVEKIESLLPGHERHITPEVLADMMLLLCDVIDKELGPVFTRVRKVLEHHQSTLELLVAQSASDTAPEGGSGEGLAN